MESLCLQRGSLAAFGVEPGGGEAPRAATAAPPRASLWTFWTHLRARDRFHFSGYLDYLELVVGSFWSLLGHFWSFYSPVGPFWNGRARHGVWIINCEMAGKTRKTPQIEARN